MVQLNEVRIIGVGAELPGESLSNSDLLKFCNLPPETTEEFMEKRIGIKSRHTARKYPGDWQAIKNGEEISKETFDYENTWGTRENYSNSDISSTAAKNALKNAGISASQVDLILHSSCTPDFPLPPTSSLVQDKLEIKQCAITDIRSACCGSTQALNIAVQYLRTGYYETILVIGCDVGSVFGILDQNDPAFTRADGINACLIGDGAGALVLRGYDPEDQDIRGAEILDVVTNSVGQGEEAGMYLPAGGSVFPCCDKTIKSGKHHFHHNYKTVIKHGPSLYMGALNHMLSRQKLTLAEIDLIVPHQANGKVAEIGDSLGVDSSKIFMNFERVGNTANASLFICLDEIARERNLAPGSLILLLAAESTKWFYGATLIRWQPLDGKHTGEVYERIGPSFYQKISSSVQLYALTKFLQLRNYYLGLIEKYYNEGTTTAQ